jgi:hypothetical protein
VRKSSIIPLILLFTYILFLLSSCSPKQDTYQETETTVTTSVETTTEKETENMEVISYKDPEMPYLFFDPCDSLAEFEWRTSGVSDQVIIGDSTLDNKSLQVEEGYFGIYADKETGTYASVGKSVDIGSGPWIFEIRMDIKDLIVPSANKEWRGLVFDIFAANKRFYIAINGNGNVYGQQGNNNTQTPIRVENYKGFHTWRFIYNGASKMFVLVDDQPVGSFDGPWTVADAPDGINIRNVPLNIEKGKNHVIIDHIGFSKEGIPDWIESDPKIAFVNVMPKSDSKDILITARVTNIQKEWISDGKTRVDLYLMSGKDVVSQTGSVLSAGYAYVHMNSNNQTGIYDLKAFLIRDNTIIHEFNRKIYIPASTESVPKGGKIASVPGKTYLFDQMEFIEGYKEKNWKLYKYKYNGNEEEYYFLDSVASSEEIEIPVDAVGWFGIVMGYFNGTQAVAADLGEGYREIEVEKTIFLPKYETGDGILKEVFLGAANFTGQKLKLKAASPKKARIAYIKFIGLSDEEVSVYNSSSDGVKRAIFNNDGYSDFCSGYYPDLSSLLQRAVDIYKDKDVGIFEFCLGTTFALNHNSSIVGKPFESISEYAKDHLMRDIDKTGVNQITYFSNRDIIPVQEVAKRADEYGIKTFASLRMNAFYDPNAYPWLNGNVYDQYADYRIKNAYGEYTKNISYASETIRNLIIDILVEAASFEGVDGVNLDFNRYPDCLGYEDELVDPFIEEYGFDPRKEMNEAQKEEWIAWKASVYNEFLRTLREKLPDKEISVRIPETGWKEYGFDLKIWIQEGYIDILIPSTVGYENFYDITPFVELVKGSDVLLYGGINHYLGGHDMTKQEEDLIKKGVQVDLGHSYVTLDQYLERAYELYKAGCDGIHVFNNWKDQALIGLIGDKQYVVKWYTFTFPSKAKSETVTLEKAEE